MISEEIKQTLYNATVALKAKNCDNRDYYAGKCQALEEILALEFKYKNE